MKIYSVSIGGENVGSVNVETAGLYYRFCCECQLSGEVMFHLMLSTEEGEHYLGLLAPRNGSYVLEKMVAKKKVGKGAWKFLLRPRHEPVTQRFIPIRAEEPFAYLSRLQELVLAVRNGQMGVILKMEK